MPVQAATPLKNVKPVPPDLLIGDRIQPAHPLFGLIWINPDRLGGTPCFYASRVPLQNLFDYLEASHTVDDFLKDFDGISREQVTAVLELARTGLLAELPKA